MKLSRFNLLNNGLFPETLPPCFVSTDSKRAFIGLVKKLDSEKFHERRSDYVRYNGTKHDGNRRWFGTPNIIAYFHISSFLADNWKIIEKKFSTSSFSIGTPSILAPDAERAIKVPSLSELSKQTSKNLRYAPYVLRADISQCFPSLYTHSIPWAAHGMTAAKGDTDKRSAKVQFNALDFFIRNAQKGHTRGVLVGPDAYRLTAEFVLSAIDAELAEAVGDKIIGAARHVDDYYFGLRSEHDAHSVLSHLREVLSIYEMNINDQKTKIYASLEPINDLWAQRLKDHTKSLAHYYDHDLSKAERAISEAVDASRSITSDSPIKILFRSFDDAQVYRSGNWEFIEHNIQRIIQRHPHALDYACLLVAKRHSLKQTIDKEGWKALCETLIHQNIALRHDHEVVWLLWLMLFCDIDVSASIVDELEKYPNAHIRAVLIQAFIDEKIKRKPKIKLGDKLHTTDHHWLTNLVARASGFTKAAFSGDYCKEFEHLALKKIKLIDFTAHSKNIKRRKAISRARYGYDSDSTVDGDYFSDDFLENIPD